MAYLPKKWDKLLLRLRHLNDNNKKTKSLDGINWDHFDPSTYVREQYAPMLQADVDMVEDLIKFYSTLPDNLEVGDFATGPNLISIMVTATKAKSVKIHEYSPQNIAYLMDVMSDPDHDDWSIWGKWWDKICEIDPTYKEIDIHKFLLDKVEFYNNPYSLLNLSEPDEKYDVVSSFFGAESITDNPVQHKSAIHQLTSHTKKGGHLVTAFLIGSNGYSAGGTFPTLPIAGQDMASLLIQLDITVKFLKTYTANDLPSVEGSQLGLIMGKNLITP